MRNSHNTVKRHVYNPCGKPGVQSRAQAIAYTTRLQQAGVQISMAEVGAAWQNGYAERLMRTIKEEEVDLSEYEDYTDAVSQLGRFLDEVYMLKRIHSSLGYLTPVEFEQHWLQQQASEKGAWRDSNRFAKPLRSRL